MKSVQHVVTLTRKTSNRQNEEKVKLMINKVIDRAMKSGRGKGWDFTLSRSLTKNQDDNGLWAFSRNITFKRSVDGRTPKGKAEFQWEKICKALIKAGAGSAFSKFPWTVSGDGAEEFYRELISDGNLNPIIPVEGKKSDVKVVTKPFGEIGIDKANHFDHIYNRENQIEIIYSAIIAAKESKLENRFHCVLYGEPGAAKTELLTAVGHMVGKENEAYLKLDATSTTKAGAERELLESPYLPPILIVEEIEKTDENSLRWLLGVLDHRAEITKLNFNIGRRHRKVPMLCLATVNNLTLFKSVMSGALYSRFAHEVYCPRPDRQTMTLILEREVHKVNGKMEWIEPTLDFCMTTFPEGLGVDDPRKIIPICLCGRDNLLNGSYQKAIRATLPPRK